MLLMFLGINTIYDLRFRKILLWSVAAFSITGVCGGVPAGAEGTAMAASGYDPGILLLLIRKVTDGGVGYGDGLVVCVTGIYLGLWVTCEVVLTALFFFPRCGVSFRW